MSIPKICPICRNSPSFWVGNFISYQCSECKTKFSVDGKVIPKEK